MLRGDPQMVRGVLRAVVFAGWAIAGATPAWAEVVFDNASERSANASTITLDHTVGAGANRYLLVAIAVEGSARVIDGVGFDDATVESFGGTDAPGDGCGIELLGVVAPSIGTHQLTVRLSSRTPAWVFAVSYRGVNQQNPIGRYFSSFGSSAPSSLTVASARGDLVVDQVCVGGASNVGKPAPGGGQTARATAANGSAGAGTSDKPGSASVAVSWQATAAGTPVWAAAALSLRAQDPPAPPDAAPDVSADGPPAGPDASPEDAGATGSPVDAAGSPDPRDAATTPLDGPAREAARVAPDAAAAVASLAVGCACRMSPAPGRPRPLAPIALLALTALRAQRRRR
jgi:MYXO-CTERM domain-containing protein